MITRLVTVDDAEVLSELQTAHRAAFAPWEPVRDDAWYTVAGQRAMLVDALEAYDRGSMVPLVIVDGDEQVAGRLTLNGVTRGALQSAVLGYWVSPAHQNRGLASAAVGEAVERAFTTMGLHRLQAETLLDNTASQRVLLRNGFRPYGVAPEYLKIAGRWQDHILFHRLGES